MKNIVAAAACLGVFHAAQAFDFQLGLGSYSTKADFKELRVTGRSGETLYYNDFKDASSVKGWKSHGAGKWTVSNGVLSQTATFAKSGAAILSVPGTFPDFTLTVKARRVDGPEGFLVQTGVPHLTGGGEWVIFGGWYNKSHGIEQPPFKRVQVDGSIEAGRWYDVKVECTGERIRAWLDGRLVMESSSSAAASPAKGANTMKYDPMIFGHFIEHFDNQVYGGLFWPKHALSDEDGFRRDVIEALRDIKCPIVRWPGGCYVSSYHWKYGVGPRRQSVWDKMWGVEDSNTFGTDEYVKWCRKVGCEPYICTNAGTGNEEEMSDWVEYCNLDVGRWGRWRIANGHAKPHDVMYWSIGNECYGGDHGAKTVAQWGPFVRESAKMMRGTDRRIKLLAAALPAERWTRPLLQNAGYLLDYVSVHNYYARDTDRYLKCMMQTERPATDINRTIAILEKAGFGNGKIGIAFDEWNLRGWCHPGAGGYSRGSAIDYKARRLNDRAATYTMADAVFAACFLNTCLRHCDIVKMACFSPAVNTRGAVFVHDKGIVKRTTYHVFWMYTHLLEPNFSALDVDCGILSDGKTIVPVLDAVLTVSDDGSRRVMAVSNKHPDAAVRLDVSALTSAKTLKATVLAGDSPDAFNDIGSERRVVPAEVAFPVEDGKVALPPHSISCIRL